MELGKGKRKGTGWTFRTPGQKWDKETVQPVNKGKRPSTMVWTAFGGLCGQSDLIVMERDEDAPKQGYSAQSYLQILEDAIATLYEPGQAFMQDNALIHTAKIVRKWFEDNAIETVDWPPYSPDMNPQEHHWSYLKRLVY